MSDSERMLTALRREIDEIDDQIHDLLMRRTKVVEGVRSLKKAQRVKIRPAREAEILYRLLKRHQGHFPRRELTRIWREMIVATLRFEGAFSVAVYEDDPTSGLWDLARDQYGAYTPMTAYASVRQVIDSVTRQDSTVGILPVPRWDDVDPWWRHLATNKPDAPKVIARLPFVLGGNARGGNPEALVVCPVPQEPTGSDRTMFIAETDEGVSQAALEKQLKLVGVKVVYTRMLRDVHAPDVFFYLVELDGFVPADHDGLVQLKEAMGESLHHLFPMGGYALPLEEEMLSDPPKPKHDDEDEAEATAAS